MTTINAYAALEAGGPLTPFSYTPGPLGEDEIEIRVEYCGLCHSDISMIDNAWGRTTYPLVPGHEVIGRVSGVGRAVTTFATGDRVGLGWHAGYCMHCHYCLSGEYNLCPQAQPTIIGRHGGFADRVRAQAVCAVKLPAGLPGTAAGPLLCGGITVFNPLLQFGIQPTDTVGVIGIGGLGHLAVKFLRNWGCDVTAFTSSPGKRERAIALGATRTIDSGSADCIAKCSGEFDLILSTVDVTLDWRAYLAALKPRGRLHFVGVPLEPLDIDVVSLLRGQKSVSASPVGSPAAIARMLDFAERHDILPQVEIFAADEINRAIDHLRAGKARYRVVIAFE